MVRNILLAGGADADSVHNTIGATGNRRTPLPELQGLPVFAPAATGEVRFAARARPTPSTTTTTHLQTPSAPMHQRPTRSPSRAPGATV